VNKANISALNAVFKQYNGLAIAVSGGVDSGLLLAAACNYYGPENCLAIIAVSPSLATAELDDARKLCETLKVELAEVSTQEMNNDLYVANQGDRCYWCKHELFSFAIPIAASRDLQLAYGENHDDLKQHRPGRTSADENQVIAPLRSAGFTKQDIRNYARHLGLDIADKIASPCLASRIATGTKVSIDALEMIEKIESQLHQIGFELCRARVIGSDKVVFEFGVEELKHAQKKSLQLEKLATAHGQQLLEIRAYSSGAVALR
jgi:uncharacterized protein